MHVFRRMGAALSVSMVLGVAGVAAQSAPAPVQISGTLHESKPTEQTMVAGARIEVTGGELAGRTFTTDDRGRFTLPPVTNAAFSLTFKKAGYDDAKASVTQLPRDATLDLAIMPAQQDVALVRSGANDCVDLPAPPPGVPGVREYARFPVHHDGGILVKAARLPFSTNEGYVYRQTPAGWEKNEFDYILLGTPVPVQGGFVYMITFGGDKDLCAAWSVDATHPS